MRRTAATLAAAILSLGFVVTSAATTPASGSSFADAVAKIRNGYLGYRVPDPAAYLRAKAAAKAHAGQQVGSAQPTSPKAPSIGVQWDGLVHPGIQPPDTTGAVGPNSYIETVNLDFGIYSRSGVLINQGSLTQLTGSSRSLSDPQILWDNNDQRFYYVVITFNSSPHFIEWGFSKDSNPQSAADFCKYEDGFGYGNNLPDYPKLGNSPRFLLIGSNVFVNEQFYTGSDVAWVNKSSVGPNPISTCPPHSQFQTGKFATLKNGNGTKVFTPVPAVNTEPLLASRAEGWVVGTAPGQSNFLTVFGVFATPAGPKLSGPFTVSVPTFSAPPNAPECRSGNTLDTLDGRLERAVASQDPVHGSTDAIWTSHAVAGGAGSEQRWYEINPTVNPPTLLQSGKVTDPSLYVWNGAVSPDRVVNPSGKAFGGNMVVGFNTSNSTTCPAIQMVSKVGNNAQSGFVMVKQSLGPSTDFRWGDYSGASPDPAADLGGTEGNVWLTGEWNSPNASWLTENWEAIP